MAEKSLADTIIDNYTWTDSWKINNTSYLGNEDNWKISKQPKTFASQFIDIDKYYNHYNVVSPRVEVEFRTGSGDDDWTSLRQLVSDGAFVYEAILDNGSKKECLFKDDTYTIDGTAVKVGDTVGNGKITAINKVLKGGNANNNYFVSATIEDTGYRTLQLELFDRSFTTIQAMIFEAIKHASSQKPEEGSEKTSNSKTSFDLEFVKMPALTRNNIRIRYGYNDSVDTTVPKEYWGAAGLNNDFYQADDKYRWISREFNDKEKRKGQTNGNSGEIQLDDNGNIVNLSNATIQDISTDNALFYLNNQSTILGGFEEFYITNVQSTLTNTGIRYTITAVGSDALKLNGYKFVQKYANIIDKPKNVLASLMRCFNFTGNGTSAKSKDTGQTMMKLVWCDDRPLTAAKKILPTKEGYKAYSADEQRDEVEKDKVTLGDYKKKIITAQRLLGCLTSDNGDNFIAGNILEQKKVYSDWRLTKQMATTRKTYNEDLHNVDKKSPIWFSCFAQIKGIIPTSWSVEKEAFFAYYMKNYGVSRITSDKIDTGEDPTTGTVRKVYNCDNSDVMVYNGGSGTYPCNYGNNFLFSRIARAVLADIIADNVYDFGGSSLIDTINQHYTVKSQQLNKVDAAYSIFKTLQGFIKEHLVAASGKSQYYIKLPISFINAMNSEAAKKMIELCYKQRTGGARLGNATGNGWTVLRPADDMFSNLPDAVGNGDRYAQEKEKWANNLFRGLKEKEVKEEDFINSVNKIDNTNSAAPQEEYGNFDLASLVNLSVAFSYAIGVAGMTGKASDSNNTTVSIDTKDKVQVKLSGSTSQELEYGYVCFDFSNANETYNASGTYKDGGEIKFTPEGTTRSTTVKEYLDDITKKEHLDRFMAELNRSALDFKNAYVLEEQAIENNDSWAILSTEEQLKKIKQEIQSADLTSFKIKLNNAQEMDNSFREIDSFNGVRSGKTITQDLYERIAKYAPAGPAGSDTNRDFKFEEDDYVKLAQDITKAISKVNDKYNELNKKTMDNESAIASDEITLSLGGPESAVDGSKFYKSISSLLNEFCNACPPYHDYEQEAAKKTAYAKGAKQEDVAEYTDADGNKQTLDLNGEAPTYNLTWDIIGKYNDGKGEVPVVGLHYRVPRKPAKIRMYKWGTGNPDMHAVKNVNITTSSEFALLSSAANSKLEIGIGGEKVAIKGVSKKPNIDGANNSNIQATYNNYKTTEEPAYFKNIVSDNDQYSITDAAFQAINKGTITLLGDPSLRFGGFISPMTYPIYLDISLQDEGATWKQNRATKSTMSGIYVVSKITHSINAQGYLTTLEVLRYPGINETVA